MMQFGLMLRAQFPPGDDMQARFQEQLAQARLADALGYASITKGMHYQGERNGGDHDGVRDDRRPRGADPRRLVEPGEARRGLPRADRGPRQAPSRLHRDDR